MTSIEGQHHRAFNRQDGKTLGLAALGGALEFYDFVVFVFFTRVLGELFFPPGTEPWLAQAKPIRLAGTCSATNTHAPGTSPPTAMPCTTRSTSSNTGAITPICA